MSSYNELVHMQAKYVTSTLLRTEHLVTCFSASLTVCAMRSVFVYDFVGEQLKHVTGKVFRRKQT